MRETLEEFGEGVKFGGQRITTYADDTILVCVTRTSWIRKNKWEGGLLLNTKKSKVLVVYEGKKDQRESFLLDGSVKKEVQVLEFLGFIVNSKGNYSHEIKRRLAIAWNVIQNMTKIWKSRIPTTLKVRLIKSTAFAEATYVSKSWKLKKSENKMIDALRCGAVLSQNSERFLDRED